MIPKPLKDLTVADVALLIDAGRAEDRTIEYKSELPGDRPSDKVSGLLKAVCAFANTDGGDLVIGVRAKDGVPMAIVGIELPSSEDALKLNIETTILSNIEPQIRGVETRTVEIEGGRRVVVVRVPKSWTAPHRVKANARFYVRNTSGTSDLDVPQLRQSFLLSETLSEQIRQFWAERVGIVRSSTSPIPLRQGLIAAMHLVPYQSLVDRQTVSFQGVKDWWLELAGSDPVAPDFRHNFDGFIVTKGEDRNGRMGYTQVFRNGAIEMLRVCEDLEEKRISPYWVESTFCRALPLLMKRIEALDRSPPVYLFFTLIGARNFTLWIDPGSQFNWGAPRRFERDVMAFQSIEIDSFSFDSQECLKPVIDQLWNAAGYSKAMRSQ